MKSKLKLKKALLISVCCLSVLFCIVYYFQDYLLLKYYNTQVNHFKKGDKLYAENWIVNDKASYNINLYRLIRPINKDDIDAMNITLSQKALINKHLNKSDKPYLLQCTWAISSDSLCKYKTAFIGIYNGVEVLQERIKDEYFSANYYVISPNKKALIKETTTIYDLPSGYVWADGPFYIRASDGTNTELNTFRIVK